VKGVSLGGVAALGGHEDDIGMNGADYVSWSTYNRLGCDMNAMPNAVRRREDDASCSGVLTVRRREDDASCSGVLTCGLENATLMLVDVHSLYADRAW
jgi:hypothetical protein